MTAAHPVRWMWMLQQLGLDFAVVDTEHAPLDRSQVADLVAAITFVGCAPLVRVSHPDPVEVVKALDAGAHGVMLPYCETPEEVAACVRVARHRPIKRALLDRSFAGSPLPKKTRAAVRQENRHSFVVMGIESLPALERLPELLAAESVDAVFVGVSDLSYSLGHPDEPEHPVVVKAFERVLRVCREQGVPMGIWPLSATLAQRWKKRGMRFVLHGSDEEAMFKGFQADFEQLKK